MIMVNGRILLVICHVYMYQEFQIDDFPECSLDYVDIPVNKLSGSSKCMAWST